MIFICDCTKDKGLVAPPVMSVASATCLYKNDIKPLILLKCAVSGCHVQGFPFGDYTIYADLKTRVGNGKVNTVVFENKLMPPAGATPLTDEELKKLKCWIDDGAPEN